MLEKIITKSQKLMRKGTAKAKNYARKNILTPIIIGTIGIASILNPQQTTAQTIKTDTIYGNGIIQTIDSATNNFLGDVTLYLRPEENSKLPDTTYELKTDIDGMTDFNLPISIDTITTGIKQYKNQKNIKIWPNPANGFNTETTKNQIKEIKIYDIQGRTIKDEQEQNTKHAFTSLKNQPNGTYIYAIKLDNNNTITGKFIKTNKPARKTNNNNYNNTTNNKPLNLKTNEIKTANYWIKWEKKGYKTDSTLKTIKGKTDWSQIINIYLNKKAPLPPGTITFTSTARSLDSLIAYNNKGDSIPAPLKGAIAYLIDFNKNKVIGIDTTDENGKFTFHKIPQNIETVFLIGNKKGYYSFGGIHYITPNNIKAGTDSTIENVFNATLPKIRITTKGDTVPASHIADQNLDGTVMGTMIIDSTTLKPITDTTGTIKIEFTKNKDPTNTSYGMEYTQAQKDTIIARIQEYIREEGNRYKIQVVNKLPRDKNGTIRTGILISPGSNATNASQIEYKTPLGKNYPTIWAKMHLSPGGEYKGIVHEMKRAFGFGETSYSNSVMNQFAKVYTAEDKEIGKLSRDYHRYEYHTMPHTPKNTIITNPNLSNIRAKAYTVKVANEK